MKRSRKPRQPTANRLLATQIEAEEGLIIKVVAAWRAFHRDRLSPEASHNSFEAYFFERLMNFDGTLDAATIVRAARLGHPPPDRALRHYIQVAMEADLFHTLPTSVRDYARECLARVPPIARYPSTARQVVNHFARDVGICHIMSRIKRRYPAIPLLHSSKRRRSVAALVGKAFGITEKQTRRIYQADATIAEVVAQFFAGYENPGQTAPTLFVR
jgi:hypothetical protein